MKHCQGKLKVQRIKLKVSRIKLKVSRIKLKERQAASFKPISPSHFGNPPRAPIAIRLSVISLKPDALT
jgi:hypothetical protein